jgi:hypothetical protein
VSLPLADVNRPLESDGIESHEPTASPDAMLVSC